MEFGGYQAWLSPYTKIIITTYFSTIITIYLSLQEFCYKMQTYLESFGFYELKP